MAIGVRQLDVEWLKALSALAIVLASCRLDAPGPLGAETIAAMAIAVVLMVTGLPHHGRRTVRSTLAVGGAIGVFALAATAVFAASAASARTPLVDGNDAARRGLSLLSTGEVAAARVQFARAAGSFDDATGRLGRPWTQPARLVPVAAQHRAAAADLADGAASASHRIAATLEGLDIDEIRVVEGKIDIESVRALEQRFVDLQQTVDELTAVIERVHSPWLIDAVQRRLDDLSVDLTERHRQGDDALAAVRAAPSILGADRPMVYFIAFATPSEARGSVGFMGNYAEITIDAGQIELTDFGRQFDLRDAADPTTRRLRGMDEFLQLYGRYGFNTGPAGSADRAVWQIVTMSPHFPSTAEVISQLYPLSGGQPVDGVFAMDPTVIAALLEFTGPISIDDGELTLNRWNAEQYLLIDQYVDFADDNVERVDALETLSLATIERLLEGALPGPVQLGRTFSPLAEERHLSAWMADPAAQDLVERVGLDHSLPELDGHDGLAIAFNNGSGNKIEVFLDTTLDYQRHVDPATGDMSGRVRLELTNTAPSSGLPPYVIGNLVGLPPGSNRLLVRMYAPFPYETAMLDGEPLELSVEVEQGWPVMGTSVDIASGQTLTLEFTFSGSLPGLEPDTDPVVVMPNLVREPTVTITTSAGDSSTLTTPRPSD